MRFRYPDVVSCPHAWKTYFLRALQKSQITEKIAAAHIALASIFDSILTIQAKWRLLKRSRSASSTNVHSILLAHSLKPLRISPVLKSCPLTVLSLPFTKPTLVLRLWRYRAADGSYPAPPSRSDSTSLDSHTCSLSAIKSSWPLRAPCISGVFPLRYSMQMLAPACSMWRTHTAHVTLRTYGFSVFSMFNSADMFSEMTFSRWEIQRKSTVCATNEAVWLGVGWRRCAAGMMMQTVIKSSYFVNYMTKKCGSCWLSSYLFSNAREALFTGAASKSNSPFDGRNKSPHFLNPTPQTPSSSLSIPIHMYSIYIYICMHRQVWSMTIKEAA